MFRYFPWWNFLLFSFFFLETFYFQRRTLQSLYAASTYLSSLVSFHSGTTIDIQTKTIGQTIVFHYGSILNAEIRRVRQRIFSWQLSIMIDLFRSFLNCVLSSVLSYQLSWLSTVSPSLVKTKQQILFKSKAEYVRSWKEINSNDSLWFV